MLGLKNSYLVKAENQLLEFMFIDEFLKGTKRKEGIKLEYPELGNTFHHIPSRIMTHEQVSLVPVCDICKWNNFCFK